MAVDATAACSLSAAPRLAVLFVFLWLQLASRVQLLVHVFSFLALTRLSGVASPDLAWPSSSLNSVTNPGSFHLSLPLPTPSSLRYTPTYIFNLLCHGIVFVFLDTL